MDTKQFLAEFGHIANAADGIHRLRKMVLTLSVIGKLTSPRKDEFIRENIFNLISENVQKREYELPNNWRIAKFKDLLSFQGGGQPPKSTFSHIAKEGYVQLIQIRDLGKNPQPVYIPKELAPKFCTDKDIMVGRYGASVGKVFWGKNGAYNVALIKMEDIHSAFLPTYLFNLLNSQIGQDLFIGITRSAQSGFNKKDIADKLIPLPPLEEQARIVAKVDELMVLCDKLESQQQQKRQLQNQLRQATLQAVSEASSPFELKQQWGSLQDNFEKFFSAPADVQELRNLIMNLAISGKLTEISTKQDINNVIELASKLKRIKKGKRFAKVKIPEEPFEIPAGWQWFLLEDLLRGSESGWSPKCHSEARQNDNWGVLKVSAVTWGKYNPKENKALPASLDPRPEAEVKPGDFLLSRANTAELVARSVIVPQTSADKLMMSDKIVRLQFLDDKLKDWVNLANNSSYAKEYYYQRATGTSDSMRNVSRQVMHELPIPIPSFDQQKMAMRKISSFIGLCNSLETKLEKKQTLAEQFAITSVGRFTGIRNILEDKSLKTPKTELIAPVTLGKSSPGNKDDAPLAKLLARQNGSMNSTDLWQRFGGEIDVFYAQLKTEVAHSWIAEPLKAVMLETDQ